MVLLIIFGTRGVTTTSESGDFHCPACETKRRYEQKTVRRYFTLYFLPLIPLDVRGVYVECQTCKGTFGIEVLRLPPDHQEKQLEAMYHAAIKRVMVLMMLADGVIEDEEIETIQLVYEKIAKKKLTRADIDEEVGAAKKLSRPLAAYLGELVGRLNDAGKAAVVKAAYFVAAADGKITEEETRLLAEIAAALEMSPTDFKAVIDKVVEAA